MSNESSVVWDDDFKKAMFHTTRPGVFRQVLKRLEPDVDFVALLESCASDLHATQEAFHDLQLDSGITVRLATKSYSINNIPKEKMRSPTNAFKITKPRASDSQ